MVSPPFATQHLVWVARMLVGATFLASAAAKLRDPDEVVRGALRYHILPARPVRPLARLLPVGELLLAAGLLAGVAVRPAAVLSLLLITVFAVAVSLNLWRGRTIPCHCFGTSSHERIGRTTLLRLVVLGVAALTVAAQAAPTGGVLPKGASFEDTVSLTSMALSSGLVVMLLGPGQVLWRGVTTARVAARWRREEEAEQIERRREQRRRRWKGRAEARRDGSTP